MPIQSQESEFNSESTGKKIKPEEIFKASDEKEKLIPVINHLAEKQEYKLAVLNDKIQSKTAKIQKHTAKIDKLQDRADNLKSSNKMLNVIAQGALPPIKKAIELIIQKNESEIDKILTQRIPKRQEKIQMHSDKIKVYSNRIDKALYKLAVLKNMSKLIKSFTITDKQERQESFLSALSGLNQYSQSKLESRITNCKSKIASLRQEYEATDSAVTKFELNNKIGSLFTTQVTLEGKLDKLKKAENAYADIGGDSQKTDDVMNHAEKSLDKHIAEDKNKSISDIAENVVAENADFIEAKKPQRKKTAEKTEKKSVLKELDKAKKTVEKSAKTNPKKEKGVEL